MDQAETSGAPSEALNHSNSTATYVYRPVESARTIRLLELYQGAHNDPLRGNLFHLGLDDTSDEDSSPSWPNVWLDEETKHTATSYEALSYVWGPPSYTHSLSCVEGTIPITPSLDEALRRIRFENRHRIVWADGVCINQHDIQERGHQVKLMGVIYDRATKVLVWLGPDAGNRARESFDYFKGYHSHINDTGDRLVLDMVRYCQWFERLWVVQEVALSRSAVAMWGNEEMDFGPLAEAILDYDKRLPKHTLCAADNYAKRRSVALGTPIDILASARGLKCADDHDRVYALLGFSSLSPRYMRKMDMAIEPDYTLPLHDLYYEVAIRAIEGGAFSELLTQVDHGGVLARWPTGLPSWVPDWRKSIALPPRIDLGRVTPSINKATASLNITGYCFDVVRSISKPLVDCVDTFGCQCNAYDAIDSVVTFWSQDVRPLTETQTTSGGLLPDLAFCGALLSRAGWSLPSKIDLSWVAGQLTRFYDLQNPTPSAEAMLKSIEESRHQSGDSRWSPLLDDTFLSYLKGRRLFVTAENYIGLGPEAMRAGDLVASFDEEEALFIVRKQDHFYRFVGAAFIPGSTDSRAIDRLMRNSEGLRTFEIR